MPKIVSLPDLHAALLTCETATPVFEALFGAPASMSDVREEPAALALDWLPVARQETLIHRSARLCVAGMTLALTDLWYVPSRLPEERLAALRTSGMPFGRVMQGVGLTRRLLSSRFHDPGGQTVLEHHAIIRRPDGLPVAEVRERFQRSPLLSDSPADG